MIAAFLARWITPYLVWLLVGLLVLAIAAAGVQSYRLKALQARASSDAVKASQQALADYQALAISLDTAAGKLLITQQERDDALRKTGRKVIEYVSRPGGAVQCLDDDGLRIIADLASGTATDPGAPAGPVPRSTPAAD